MKESMYKNKFIRNLYIGQVRRSKLRKHSLPAYTFEEFKKWIYDNDEFETLYSNWLKNNKHKDLTPSIDRLENNKGYSFDNIQLITWKENKVLGNISRRVAIMQFDLEGKFIKEYASITEVNLAFGLKPKDMAIPMASKGLRYSSHGYIWIYKKDYTENSLKEKIIKRSERFDVCHLYSDSNGNKKLFIYNGITELSLALRKMGFNRGTHVNTLLKRIKDFDDKEFFYFKDIKKYIDTK